MGRFYPLGKNKRLAVLAMRASSSGECQRELESLT
jgi:hypothetical protein